MSYKVDMRGKHLAWLLERIDRQRTYYLMGKMIVGKEFKQVSDINLYRPADFDGKVLHLHYARAEELDPYLYMVAAQGGEVYVQFWLLGQESQAQGRCLLGAPRMQGLEVFLYQLVQRRLFGTPPLVAVAPSRRRRLNCFVHRP